MDFSIVKDSTAGATIGFLAFILIFSSIPIQPVAAQGQPIFSLTLVAPTTNPARRQWAAIIANSYQTVNIKTNLVYVSFGVLIDRLFPSTCPCGVAYDKGGFDAGFVGFSAGVIPDIKGVTNYAYSGPNDVPPVGENYAFYNNQTVTQNILTYSGTLDPAVRTTLAQKIFAMVQQDRPYLVLLDTANIFPFKSYIFPWNQQKVYAEQTLADFEHWKLTQGNTINVALSADVNSLNPAVTNPSNSVYDQWIYASPLGTYGGGAVYLDPRDFLYHNALATSITSTPDGLTWTVNLRSGVTFADSASVTADDFVFNYLAGLRSDVGEVTLGTNQLYFGLGSKFTFLNGTSRFVSNGTYYTSQSKLPSSYKQTSTFTATSATSFTFTLPALYAFTNPALMITGLLPMHVMEKLPAAQWGSLWVSTLQNTPVTYTWSTSQYGGNGSYAYGFGPVGDGPYMYRGYNLVTRTATLIKNPTYWNASGLAAIGEFNANTIHVVTISGAKDAALAAFSAGTVNFLDDNYVFIPQDYPVIEAAGGVHPQTSPPGGLWQEMGLNMNNPIWGTGTATPLGQSNPSKAAFAARQVRAALSYLIPRTYIVQTLQPTGKPGIVEYMDTFPTFYPPGAKPDPYDPAAARGFLAAAGFSVGTSPTSTGGAFTLPTSTVTVPGSTVTVPNFLLGNSFILSGRFAVDPVKAAQFGGFAVTLQQSTDSGATWTPVLFTVTGTGVYYSMTYTPTASGTVWFRTHFTGIPATLVTTSELSDPATIESLVSPLAVQGGRGRLANVTVQAYSDITKLQIGTFGDVVKLLASGAQLNATAIQLNTAINSLGTATQNSLNSLKSTAATAADLTTLTGTVNNLSGNVTTLSNVSYAALAVAVVLGLIAIFL
jgi:ABC-type transport system substrate-binding protein